MIYLLWKQIINVRTNCHCRFSFKLKLEDSLFGPRKNFCHATYLKFLNTDWNTLRKQKIKNMGSPLRSFPKN